MPVLHYAMLPNQIILLTIQVDMESEKAYPDAHSQEAPLLFTLQLQVYLQTPSGHSQTKKA